MLQSLNRRNEKDIELWGFLAKAMVNMMNKKQLKFFDLMAATNALVKANVRSEKLYGFIVRYFLTIGFDKEL